MKTSAVDVSNLHYSYGKRVALQSVSFSVGESELFGLVGPNGGGKSTTFRILSSLIKPQSGSVNIFGQDIIKNPTAVRSLMGVVFQSPALDKKLTVFENLLHQGNLYGLRGAELRERSESLLKQMELADRKKDRVETLSGGLKRRLEIAKSLIHRPKLLILDEPTTGLDPLARRDVWNYLGRLKAQEGLTTLVTTHLLDEAEACNQVAFLDWGRIVACGEPEKLKATIGGEVITLKSSDPEKLKKEIEEKFGTTVSIVERELRIQKRGAHEFIPSLVSAFPDEIQSVHLGKPTLEDIFIETTGHHYQ